jgi:prevent-host-death family protein
MPIIVSAAELGRHTGRYRQAAHREVVVVTARGAPDVCLLSATEYERYRTMQRREREAFSLKELPEEVIRAIATAPIDAELDMFKDEAPS